MSSMRVGKKVRCCNALVLNPRLSALRRSDGENQSRRRVRIEASVLMHRRRHTYQQVFNRILQPTATAQLASPAVYSLQRKAFP